MNGLSAIIMAAGKGTRMQSDLPKVVHEVAGRPMALWVAEACAQAGCGRVVVVVGHRQEDVRAAFEHGWTADAAVEFAVQEPQHGTGHAVRCAEAALGADASAPGHAVFVLAGDGPLIRAETLAQLVETHRETGAAATMATAVLDDPAGYGRIVRGRDGDFEAIVEEKNCDDDQRAIREVNPSYYCFDAPALFDALGRVERNPVSGEYYLTDAPALLLAEGRRVEVVEAVPPEDVLSINTPEQLALVDGVLRRRLASVAAGGG